MLDSFEITTGRSWFRIYCKKLFQIKDEEHFLCGGCDFPCGTEPKCDLPEGKIYKRLKGYLVIMRERRI